MATHRVLGHLPQQATPTPCSHSQAQHQAPTPHSSSSCSRPHPPATLPRLQQATLQCTLTPHPALKSQTSHMRCSSSRGLQLLATLLLVQDQPLLDQRHTSSSSTRATTLRLAILWEAQAQGAWRLCQAQGRCSRRSAAAASAGCCLGWASSSLHAGWLPCWCRCARASATTGLQAWPAQWPSSSSWCWPLRCR